MGNRRHRGMLDQSHGIFLRPLVSCGRRLAQVLRSREAPTCSTCPSLVAHCPKSSPVCMAQVFATLSIIVGIVATREEDYPWEMPRIKRDDRGGNTQAVQTAATASKAAPSLSTSSAGAANDLGGQVLSTKNGLAGKGEGAAISAVTGSDADELKYPYPFYKISLDEGGQKWKYPGAGWASSEKLTVEVPCTTLALDSDITSASDLIIWFRLTFPTSIRTRDSGQDSSFTCMKMVCLTIAKR